METVMRVAARSDEHGSKPRPFPGVLLRQQAQLTATACQPLIAFLTAVTASNDRMRETQFPSYNPVSYPGQEKSPSLDNPRTFSFRGFPELCLSHAAIEGYSKS
jgi:hypothetical protein